MGCKGPCNCQCLDYPQINSLLYGNNCLPIRIIIKKILIKSLIYGTSHIGPLPSKILRLSDRILGIKCKSNSEQMGGLCRRNGLSSPLTL